MHYKVSQYLVFLILLLCQVFLPFKCMHYTSWQHFIVMETQMHFETNADVVGFQMELFVKHLLYQIVPTPSFAAAACN